MELLIAGAGVIGSVLMRWRSKSVDHGFGVLHSWTDVERRMERGVLRKVT